MKAQLILVFLLCSTVVFAVPKTKKLVKKKVVTSKKKKEEIVKKVEPCALPTPDPLKEKEITPDTINLQGLGSSTGCKLNE